MAGTLKAVHVLATQPPCPLCGALPMALCADGNRVHLPRTVRIAALVAVSPLVPTALRVQWDQGGQWLRWIADPARPHLVFSELVACPPAGVEADERAWARIEIPYALALQADVLPLVSADAVGDRDAYGTPGALPPAPLPEATRP